MTVKRFSLALAITLLCALFSLTQAQTPRLTTVNITSEGERVHVAAQGDVSEMRIEVSDEQGDIVFQSGAITGQQLDWNMSDAQGERVVAGTYLVTVTYRNAAGKMKKRVEQVTVDEAEKAGTQTPAAPQETQASVPVKTTGTVTANKIPKFVSIGPNQATVTNSIITESAGKIGIGTSAPSARLTVVAAMATVAQVDNTSTAADAYAVKGKITSTSPGAGSAGVRGINSGTGNRGSGVYGSHNGGGYGVYGTAPTGLGVLGTSTSGIGVQGSSGGRAGVLGTTSYVNGSGVEGNASGSNAAGVFGVNTNGAGVWGRGTNGSGVYGESNTRGVYGTSTANGGIGVYGTSNHGRAIWGVSSNSFGVEGDSTSNVGVAGYSDSNNAVQGVSKTGPGVYGESTSNAGLAGKSTDGPGAQGISTNGTGVVGQSTSGYAGYFIGKAKVTGNLEVGSCTGCTISSDHNLKTNFSTINPRLVLDRLSAIPIKAWNYKSDDSSVRHIGPMAQDFRAAFNLGVDDKHIDMIDANGVTMAAIQGLYQMMQEKEKKNEQLFSEVQQLRAQLLQQQTQLNQVKRTIKRKRTARR